MSKTLREQSRPSTCPAWCADAHTRPVDDNAHMSTAYGVELSTHPYTIRSREGTRAFPASLLAAIRKEGTGGAYISLTTPDGREAAKLTAAEADRFGELLRKVAGTLRNAEAPVSAAFVGEEQS